MKKSTMITIADYIKNVPDLTNEYNELMNEINRNSKKAESNRALYDAAWEVAENYLANGVYTAEALYNECKDELPAGFTKSKLQYALLNYWRDNVDIVKGEGANKYCRK